VKTPITEKLAELLGEADGVHNEVGHSYWTRRVIEFLRVALGASAAAAFDVLSASTWSAQLAKQRGHLDGLMAKGEASEHVSQASDGGNGTGSAAGSRTVFVVHGHDGEAKESVARFLEQLGLLPVILHEQASGGRTAIERFETYADDVAFSIVLLTADDVGSLAATASELTPRARQHVVMELGYFIGKLGRMRVCALHEAGVELPSDYQGVLYVEMDPGGIWKAKLAQGLVEARVPIELGALLGRWSSPP
jgi:predicted nucleotide-binding protein